MSANNHSRNTVALAIFTRNVFDTDVNYELEICKAVMEVWQPTVDNKFILNPPATVEVTTSNVYVDQIRWFCHHLTGRNKAIISLHIHNDHGTGVVNAELALLDMADQVEGILFENDERTGNLDIVTIALNLYPQGVDPGLDFSNPEHMRAKYERVTRMRVPERQPYLGDLVFTAFSSSYQDATKKEIDLRAQEADPNAL